MATLKASSLMVQFLIAAQNLSYIALLTLTVILSSTFLGKIFYSKFAFIAEMTVVLSVYRKFRKFPFLYYSSFIA